MIYIRNILKNIEEDSKVNDNEKKDTKVKIKKITLSSDKKIYDEQLKQNEIIKNKKMDIDK